MKSSLSHELSILQSRINLLFVAGVQIVVHAKATVCVNFFVFNPFGSFAYM